MQLKDSLLIFHLKGVKVNFLIENDGSRWFHLGQLHKELKRRFSVDIGRIVDGKEIRMKPIRMEEGIDNRMIVSEKELRRLINEAEECALEYRKDREWKAFYQRVKEIVPKHLTRIGKATLARKLYEIAQLEENQQEKALQELSNDPRIIEIMGYSPFSSLVDSDLIN